MKVACTTAESITKRVDLEKVYYAINGGNRSIYEIQGCHQTKRINRVYHLVGIVATSSRGTLMITQDGMKQFRSNLDRVCYQDSDLVKNKCFTTRIASILQACFRRPLRALKLTIENLSLWLSCCTIYLCGSRPSRFLDRTTMIRNPKELTSAQLMIALVAILCELSDRLGLIQNANLDTLSASLAASPNLNSEVPIGTPDAGAPEISGIDAAGANPAPAYAMSEAGSDLSVLFDADGDTATTGAATRPFNSPMAVTGASVHSGPAVSYPIADEEEPTPLVVSTNEVGSMENPTIATATNENGDRSHCW